MWSSGTLRARLYGKAVGIGTPKRAGAVEVDTSKSIDSANFVLPLQLASLSSPEEGPAGSYYSRGSLEGHETHWLIDGGARREIVSLSHPAAATIAWEPPDIDLAAAGNFALK